jgi:hypothetical protein
MREGVERHALPQYNGCVNIRDRGINYTTTMRRRLTGHMAKVQRCILVTFKGMMKE